MAADFDASTQPRDVVAALSLRSGMQYTCQNVDTTATLFVRETAAVPLVTARAFRIPAGGNFTLKISVDPIFLWTDDADGCAVIVEEAA